MPERDLLRDARTTAGNAQAEGLEIFGNLGEIGDALRSNAERMLRNVQGVHSELVGRLDQVEPPAPRTNGEAPDVLEFIPPA